MLLGAPQDTIEGFFNFGGENYTCNKNLDKFIFSLHPSIYPLLNNQMCD